MRRLLRNALLPALLLAAWPAAAAGDEIDDLASKLNVRARFHSYKPKFHYRQRTLSFETARGTERRLMRMIMDGESHVALISDDHIQMLAFTPGSARQTLYLRSGRYHLDNIRGPVMPTDTFLEQRRSFRTRGVVGIPQSDHFRGGGPKVTLVRASDSRQRKVLSQFTFSVHEQFGYIVEGTTTVLFRKATEGEARKADVRIFCPNSYVPWPTRWIYDRTAFCPAGSSEILAYPNNTLVIDRVDRNSRTFTWRDRGFIAFLNAKGGLSPCRTRDDGGPPAKMTLDNVRNELQVTIPFNEELKKDAGGRETYTLVQRLLALPPEMTDYLRKNAKTLAVGGKGIILRIGKTEDFEDQPVSLDQPIRGLAWTVNAPRVTTEVAHSGRQSLILTGQYTANDPKVVMEPDIPYIPLRPKATYLLEAWFKVENMTAKDRGDYLAAYQKMAAKLKEAEQEVPEYVPPKPHAQAYLTANLYEWTPKDRKWIVRQQTSVASGHKTDWQKATLEFTTPAWDPYIHVAFVCDSGSAFIDDFTLKRVR